MGCNLIGENLPLLINNRLSRAEYFQALIHLAQCKDCRDELILATKIKNQIERGFKEKGEIPEIEIPVQVFPRYWRKEVDNLVEGLIFQMFSFSKLS